MDCRKVDQEGLRAKEYLSNLFMKILSSEIFCVYCTSVNTSSPVTSTNVIHIEDIDFLTDGILNGQPIPAATDLQQGILLFIMPYIYLVRTAFIGFRSSYAWNQILYRNFTNCRFFTL
jgi:hypothetical protein